MPMMQESTGNFSVSGHMRALEPWTISTISSCPAPTVSTQTNVRPVPTNRSRLSGSTRRGSTVKSLRPVMEASFCVATTLPVTLARNISTSPPSILQPLLCLPGDDQFFVGWHGPNLHATGHRVDWHFTLCLVIADRIQVDSKPIQVRAYCRTNGRRVFADASRKNNCVRAVQQ